MSRNVDTGISLATPPAIHVGPILNPNTNETISIVIPLSAQLTTVSNQRIEKSCRDCGKDTKPPTANSTASRPRNDKTKGCPYPNCVRYGRSFSRAHDLKRHIARHEMRKEKLSEIEKQQFFGGVAENIRANFVAQRDRQFVPGNKEDSRDTAVRSYSSSSSRKRNATDNKLRAYMNSHDKAFAESNGESSQRDVPDKDDDFLLEEMLLLNKNLKRQSPDKMNTNGTSKIRCDYCSKTFKTKWTLSSHVAAHEGRFQFDCNQCGKKFVRKSHYQGHIRTHEAARPYICEQCGKTFKELKHRREHTKRKHPNNQNAIQNLLDSISPCPPKEMPSDQTKFTLLVPMNFPG